MPSPIVKFPLGSPFAVSAMSFDATDYLEVSSANWGSYDRAKFAIAGAFYRDAGGVAHRVIGKGTVSAGAGAPSAEFEVIVTSGNRLDVLFEDLSGNVSRFTGNSTALGSGQWYAFLIHYDRANATSTDRIKVWINNSAETSSTYTAPSADTVSNSDAVRIGYDAGAGTGFDGELYRVGFFDSVLPTAEQVFEGSSGGLKNFSSLSGLHSYLASPNAVVTKDDALGTDWTNSGVAASLNIPE